MKWRPAAAAALLLAGPASAFEPTPATLKQLSQAKDFSGVALAAAAEDEVPFAYTAGSARQGSPITAATQFDIGSIGKMLTAVAVLQLVEAGKVELDAPVGRHLPDLPEGARGRTVASLLSHRAGFGDVLSIDGARRAKSNHEFYRLLLTEVPGPAGNYVYSNSGFVALGELVARTSGESYETYLSKHVFEPAGMRDTVFVEAGRSSDPRRAVGLIRTNQSGAFSIEAEDRWATSAAGGLYSTAGDVAAFGRALVSGRLISSSSLERMCPKPLNGEPMVYGMGCMSMADGGMGHLGQRDGMEALLLASLRGDVVVSLSNRHKQAEPVFWPLWQAVTRDARP